MRTWSRQLAKPCSAGFSRCSDTARTRQMLSLDASITGALAVLASTLTPWAGSIAPCLMKNSFWYDIKTEKSLDIGDTLLSDTRDKPYGHPCTGQRQHHTSHTHTVVPHLTSPPTPALPHLAAKRRPPARSHAHNQTKQHNIYHTIKKAVYNRAARSAIERSVSNRPPRNCTAARFTPILLLGNAATARGTTQ